MKTRYTVLGFSLVLALAMAVPALGGPSNPASKAALTLQKVNTKAKNALNAANAAQTTANQANTAAAAAQSSANAANANANTRIRSVVRRTDITGDNNTTPKSLGVPCQSGEDVTGGGFVLGGTAPNNIVVNLSDQGTGLYGVALNSWEVSAHALAGTPIWSLRVIAECGQKPAG
jgi:hypothetical protein